MLLKLLYVPILNTFYMSNYATGVSIPPSSTMLHQYKLSFNIIIKIFYSQSVVTGGVDFRFGATQITLHAINRR